MALDNNSTNDFSNVNNLCMGCMLPCGESEQCPECGWVEGTQPNSPLYLAPRMELNKRYVIGRVLGHGGFGITYLGWDQELHLKVAIKEYLPDGLGTRALGDRTVSIFSGQYGQDFEYGLEKFLTEARTLARFQSNSNIVSIMNFFKENGTAYIVMEYVEGISLKQYLQHKEDGRMPLDEALNYIMPVADALSLVHAEGILHRDISPDNIYVTKNYHVKLLDFGASRKAMSEVNKSLSVLLKPGYAPVEQYSSRGVQGPWTDEYSLVATLYKLLSGKTPPESIDRMQGMELESLMSLGIDLPPSVEAVITRALSVQPQERYQSIEEFKAELNKALSMENGAVQAIDQANKAGISTDIPQRSETLRNEQLKTGGQTTSIQTEGGSPNLQQAGGLIRNKKALIAFSVVLIFVLPAAVYGLVSVNKPKPTDQIVIANKGNSQVGNNKENTYEPGGARITETKITEKKRIDFAALQNIVREDSNGSYSLYIRDDAAEAEYADSNAVTQKAAGGLVYIPIMITTLTESYNGKLNLGKQVTIQDIAGGTGKLTQQDSGRRLSIKQLLEIMMQYSDNTAANLLIDELGGLETINITMKNLKLDGIVLKRKLMDQEAMNRGLENYCSPRGVGYLLSLIAENKIMTAKECEYAIGIMEKRDQTGIAKYLPDNISVSHQTGVLSGIFNDAGIINTSKGRIVLVVMGEKIDQNTASDIFGKVAKAVVEQLQK